jgi:4-deoxy-L-threo-5-hexosulose-uronate ketol-isomerase
MDTRYLADGVRYAAMTAAELRDTFLVTTLFAPGETRLVYCEPDRAVIGSAVPLGQPLTLSAADELRAAFFCQRRELGVLNIGGAGSVRVDGATHAMGPLDGLYVGRGSREVFLASDDARQPAQFYLASYPAHAAFPTTLARRAEAAKVQLGSQAECNRRTIHKYIHPEGIKSCQLVMGFTVLEEGSVWNTMPPHTHTRRSEIYLYFDIAPEARVFHFMGRPDETRHVVVADRQAVVSPAWSIHCATATRRYTFCWAMGGENQTFDDMDGVQVGALR